VPLAFAHNPPVSSVLEPIIVRSLAPFRFFWGHCPLLGGVQKPATGRIKPFENLQAQTRRASPDGFVPEGSPILEGMDIIRILVVGGTILMICGAAALVYAAVVAPLGSEDSGGFHEEVEEGSPAPQRRMPSFLIMSL